MLRSHRAASQTLKRLRFNIAASVIFMVLLTAIFTVFYHYAESRNWLDSLYFTIITSKTIGFGDIYPTTTVGKIGTMFNALLPATIFVGASLVLIENGFKALELYWKNLKMRRHHDHTLIVAQTDILGGLISECAAGDQAFLVISPLDIADLPTSAADFIDDDAYLQGDPRDDEVLRRAQVTHASRLIVACEDDATSLFVLVSAIGLNPNLKTTVRVLRDDNLPKFRAVGAHYLLPSSTLTGRMLSQASHHPIAHQFLLNLHTQSENPFIQEVTPDTASLGRPVRDVFPRAIALYRHGHYRYDLVDEKVTAGDILLCIWLQPNV